MGATRLRRGRWLVFAVAAVATMVSTTAAEVAVTSAAPASGTPFAVNGNVLKADAGIPPNVPGVTGSFRLNGLEILFGNVAPAEEPNPDDPNDSDPTLRIDIQNTKFYTCDSTTCTPSTQEHVVVQGAQIQVQGRYYNAGGQYELIATYVFNPPPPPPPPPSPPPSRPPNPQPTSYRDFTLSNIYYFKAAVLKASSDLAGGYTIGNASTPGGDFADYGCGTQPGCKAELIARAHGNRLITDPQPTAHFWLSSDGGCNYVGSDAKTLGRLGATGIVVQGHYESDGGDWVFFISHAFVPPPKPASQCGVVPLPTTKKTSFTSNVSQTMAGAFDPTTNTYNESQWQGTNGPGDFGAGPTQLVLSWQQDSDGNWEFWGTFKIAASAPDTSSLSGDISGVALAPGAFTTLADFNANVTVQSATGKYAGWLGPGTWSGTVSYANLGPGSAQPPTDQQGTWSFVLTKS